MLNAIESFKKIIHIYNIVKYHRFLTNLLCITMIANAINWILFGIAISIVTYWTMSDYNFLLDAKFFHAKSWFNSIHIRPYYEEVFRLLTWDVKTWTPDRNHYRPYVHKYKTGPSNIFSLNLRLNSNSRLIFNINKVGVVFRFYVGNFLKICFILRWTSKCTYGAIM